jgi:nicotinic acid mononucleotide adenylyltransferase
MQKYTVLIAGGFKPPHKGHYDFIKFYLDNPCVEQVVLFCGEKKRDTISLEATEAVLEAYGLMKHHKLVYKRATRRNGKKGAYTNPLADCYDWADENYSEHCGLGWSSKDKGYQDGFTKYFKGDSMIITPPMFEQQDDLSATDFRKALENGKSIARFLPDHVSESQITALFKNDT